MYASTTILNALISRAPGRSGLGYLKLVYLVQGWSLAFDRPVVADMPSLYEFGPIHTAAYDCARRFGQSAITAPLAVPGARTPALVPATDVATHQLIDEVLKAYGPLTDVQLSNVCHAAGTPWRLARDSRDWRHRAGGTMTETEIHAYFSARLAEQAASKEADETERATEREAMDRLLQDAPLPFAA